MRRCLCLINENEITSTTQVKMMIGATQNQEVILASQTLVSVPRLTSMVIRGKEAKRRMKTISFVSQNVRGIKSVNRLEDLCTITTKKCCWCVFTEAWLFDKKNLEYES